MAAGDLATRCIDAQQWGLARLDRLAARFGREPDLPQSLAIGLAGEQAALFHLRRLGYVVVARRWTSAKLRGDVDLVAWERDRLCFVEVKTRSERTITPAESAVDDEKRETLRRLAREYLRVFPESERRSVAVRFDVVSVYLRKGAAEFEVDRGAFGMDSDRGHPRGGFGV